MQPVKWYFHRLQAMTPGEIASRARTALRDGYDRATFGNRRRPLPLDELITRRDGILGGPGFAAVDMEVGSWAAAGGAEREWYRRLIQRADRIANHRLDIFDLQDHDLGHPIDWNRDHKSRKVSPMRYSRSIDYRDFDLVGDCKLVWEPSRHQHLVVLGRAYRASGDARYARAAAEQLGSWLDQCPYGMGMNWRSPMELGIRLINWVWTIDLCGPSGAIGQDLRDRLLNSVRQHLWEITRQYSAHSSAGNHLIGEAAGVYLASCYFDGLRHADRWRAESREILCREILRQTFPDGGWREQALGYHMFATEFFLLSAIVARRLGQDMPAEYLWRLEKMLEFLAAFSEGTDVLSLYGDADDGYVLDLGSRARPNRSFLSLGAMVFNRGDFKSVGRDFPEPARWLLGPSAAEKYAAIQEPPDKELESKAFPEAGYYLLQHGRRGSPAAISVIFDCGNLGFPATAGHGHADALSFLVRAFGQEILTDPGTYDYYTYPEWRNYFRSSRAHNTLVIDSQDQSAMLGRFLWGSQARASCLAWEPSDSGGKVVGEHDGYRRLKQRAIHRRVLELDGPNRRLLIRDVVRSAGRHEVEICFHFAESCHVSAIDSRSFLVQTAGGSATLRLDERLSAWQLCGSTNPIGGWISRGYHRKTPSVTLIGRCTIEGDADFTCRMEFSVPLQLSGDAK